MFAKTDCYEIGCIDNTYSRGKKHIVRRKSTRKTYWHGLKNDILCTKINKYSTLELIRNTEKKMTWN